MSFHRNAKLGLAGRYALVCAIEEGVTLKAAGAAFNGSPGTGHRWGPRWLGGTRGAPEPPEAVCACRRRTGWGPRLVAGATGFSHSTVWKVLKRAGISRPQRTA